MAVGKVFRQKNREILGAFEVGCHQHHRIKFAAVITGRLQIYIDAKLCKQNWDPPKT